MPTRFPLAVLALLLAAVPACRAADSFQLTSVSPLTSGRNPAERLITIGSSGTAPALTATHLLVIAQPKAGAPIPLPVLDTPRVSQGLGIDCFIDVRPLGGADTASFTYTVSIPSMPSAGQATSTGSNMPAYHLTTAASKDKSDLYVFGSVLAGVSTKPLYVLDIKAAPRFEVGNHGLFLGGAFTLAANQSVDAPVDRSRVDPDSITGSFSLDKRFVLPGATPRNIFVDLKPVSGEFSRKYPASDLITKGNFTYEYRPFLAGNRRCPRPDGTPGNFRCATAFFLYPGIGYELGKNLNQPHTLFSLPVDLSRWNAIARVTPTATTGLYLLQRVPTADSTYRFSMTATYQPRIPFTLEPFVTTSGPAANLVKTTTLRKNTRHEIEANATWNFSSFVGLTLNYRYGSLPPLFEFVDHQVTLGLTFKGAFKRS